MRLHLLLIAGQLSLGGSERQLRLLAEQLSRRHHVEVLCLSEAVKPHGAALAAQGIKLTVAPTPGRLGRLFWLLALSRRLRCDAAVLFTVRAELALLLSFFLPGRMVFTERSGLPRSWTYRTALRWLARRIDMVITNSETILRRLMRDYPGLTARLCCVPNGIEVTTGATIEAPQAGALRFSLVAGFKPWKGHVFLVDSVTRLAEERSDFVFVLVGDGPERHGIEALISQRGLDPFFELEGSQEEPSRFMAGAQVNLNLSSHESLSNAVLEGMALGKASIVTRVGGNPELVEHKEHGLVVDYGDVDGLVAALRFFLDHREAVVEYGRAAREKALRQYSLDDMVRHFEALLTSLVAPGEHRESEPEGRGVS